MFNKDDYPYQCNKIRESLEIGKYTDLIVSAVRITWYIDSFSLCTTQSQPISRKTTYQHLTFTPAVGRMEKMGPPRLISGIKANVHRGKLLKVANICSRCSQQ